MQPEDADERRWHASSSREVCPQVTIGIPTRNRSGLLRRSIESVLTQSFENFVILVSDNASTDDTARVVECIDDPRVVYRPLRDPISRTANYNRLVEHAATEFVLLLADDDELLPDHLSLTVEALERWPRLDWRQLGTWSLTSTAKSSMNTTGRSRKATSSCSSRASGFLSDNSVAQAHYPFSSALFRKRRS